MSTINTFFRRRTIIALTSVVSAGSALGCTVAASAYTPVRYASHQAVSAHSDYYGGGLSQLVRTTTQSTGSAESGTGIVDAGTMGRYDSYCSGAGCQADTGDFSCNDWDSGSQPYMHDKSAFDSYFNGDYYTC
jgi:hypothetical protein